MRDVTQDVTPPPGRDAPKFMNPIVTDITDINACWFNVNSMSKINVVSMS